MNEIIIIDDRTEEQKKTHIFFVICADETLGRCGFENRKDGIRRSSYKVWCCETNLAQERKFVEVCKLENMKRVRMSYGEYNPNPFYCGHCHFYVVDL